MLRTIKGILVIMWILMDASYRTNATTVEDANELISMFESVVNSSVTNDILKVSTCASDIKRFTEKLIPFAELSATALNKKLDHNKLDGLLVLIKNIDRKAVDTNRQKWPIGYENSYLKLLLNYESEVIKPLRNFFMQIRFLSNARMNVTDTIIRTFVDDCNSVLSSPSIISGALNRFVASCQYESLQTDVLAQLHTLFLNTTMQIHQLTTEQNALFYHRISILYFHLSSSTTENIKLFLRDFVDRNIWKSFNNKLDVLDDIMKDLRLNDKSPAKTYCLPMAAFVASGYKRSSIVHFASRYVENLYYFQVVATFCAKISYYERSDLAGGYLKIIEKDLERTVEFAKTWFSNLLNSTWPVLENSLIADVINDFEAGGTIAETTSSYTNLTDKVHLAMEPIGHSSYARSYVTFKKRPLGTTSMVFGMNCIPNTCTLSTSQNTQVVTFRTQIDTNEAVKTFDNVQTFANSSYNKFYQAMNTRLYKYYFVNNVVALLKEDYNLDMNDFKNHSSYIVLRSYDLWSKECTNIRAVKSILDLQFRLVHEWHYHWDGYLTESCEDWVFIFA
ncbi:hypothetical protein M3Y95_00768600 [Aphelenchoides besseyi]|nr:hypothetical protein M3Y95_00768600 [Aphelenchoides besseyi]